MDFPEGSNMKAPGDLELSFGALFFSEFESTTFCGAKKERRGVKKI
jgi:hypothetical protein